VAQDWNTLSIMPVRGTACRMYCIVCHKRIALCVVNCTPDKHSTFVKALSAMVVVAMKQPGVGGGTGTHTLHTLVQAWWASVLRGGGGTGPEHNQHHPST
jgi:hypothetical protein